jgi:hypothetical protein
MSKFSDLEFIEILEKARKKVYTPEQIAAYQKYLEDTVKLQAGAGQHAAQTAAAKDPQVRDTTSQNATPTAPMAPSPEPRWTNRDTAVAPAIPTPAAPEQKFGDKDLMGKVAELSALKMKTKDPVHHRAIDEAIKEVNRRHQETQATKTPEPFTMDLNEPTPKVGS